VHELKLDGYRIHARIDRGDARLLTRRMARLLTGRNSSAMAMPAAKC
jgi:ATP-dependent DNA ligase